MIVHDIMKTNIINNTHEYEHKNVRNNLEIHIQSEFHLLELDLLLLYHTKIIIINI